LHKTKSQITPLFVNKVNKSIPKGTVERYSEKCWGCEQAGHGYVNKQEQIKDNKPGVQDHDAKARKDFNGKLKKRKMETKKRHWDANDQTCEALLGLSG
jgi:hypothetical protein